MCTETGPIAYKGDYTKYYRCSKGQRALVFHCPDGSLFDRELKICNLKSAVKISTEDAIEVR